MSATAEAQTEKFKRGHNPKSLANLVPHQFTSEKAAILSQIAIRRQDVLRNLQELANKAFEDEEICVKLARYTNAKIMADESLAPSIRLEASAPFLKKGNAPTAIQINVGAPPDRMPEPVVGTGAALPEQAIVDVPDAILADSQTVLEQANSEANKERNCASESAQR